MIRIGFVLLIAFMIMCACSGENKPATSELKTALIQGLPGHVTLGSFSIEASQNFGNKVEPVYGARFHATLNMAADLYKADKTVDGVTFVHIITEKGKPTDIFGKITSRLYQGAWRHDVNIDGNPLANLGMPLNQFSAGRVIIRGSEEENKYYDEAKQKEKERQTATEQKEAELRKNISSAAKILIGTWRDENSLMTYKSDGTRITKFDDGNMLFSKWRVDGDLIVRKDETMKSLDGKSQALDRTYQLKIIYIDKDKYTVKYNQATWSVKRIN